jgi:hypothetical protein
MYHTKFDPQKIFGQLEAIQNQRKTHQQSQGRQRLISTLRTSKAYLLKNNQPSVKNGQGNRTRFATKARNYIVTMFKALRTSSR